MRINVSPTLVLAALCASLAAPVQAAPPAAPVVTVGAGLKHLQFDWAAVPQANYYQLWFKANSGASWVKYNEAPAERTHFLVSVSVHLLDWRTARYRVAACNLSGCTNSAEVGVSSLPKEAVGYSKPPTPDNTIGYGAGTAVSADGKTIAVFSGELVGGAARSAVVNVYRKQGFTWKHDPRVVPSLPLPDTALPTQYQLSPIALNGNGTVLVLGLATHSSGTAGSPPHSGSVFIFRYDGTRWNEEARLESPYVLGYLGWHVDIDDAGELVVASRFVDRDDIPETLAYRHSNAGWTAGEELPMWYLGGYRLWCEQPALSGNGKSLVRVCGRGGAAITRYVQILRTSDWKQTGEILTGSLIRAQFRDSAIDTNYAGNRLVVLMEEGRIGMFWRGVAGWHQDGEFTGGSGAFNAFGQKLTMSRDGKLIAAGDFNSCHPGTGPVYPPFGSCSMTGGGKVTVYQHVPDGWRVRSYLKPNTTTVQAFGQSVSLGDNGKTLVVGAPFEPSNATGIDGDQTDTSAPERGAVWLY